MLDEEEGLSPAQGIHWLYFAGRHAHDGRHREYSAAAKDAAAGMIWWRWICHTAENCANRCCPSVKSMASASWWQSCAARAGHVGFAAQPDGQRRTLRPSGWLCAVSLVNRNYPCGIMASAYRRSICRASLKILPGGRGAHRKRQRHRAWAVHRSGHRQPLRRQHPCGQYWRGQLFYRIFPRRICRGVGMNRRRLGSLLVAMLLLAARGRPLLNHLRMKHSAWLSAMCRHPPSLWGGAAG